ncbi:MAG: tRNA dihydrouridine synthase DusB [Candidatus Hydrogenedentes bacterium]|nr:tRNA dihydrouridine synthase DusB [Candidatus Hydrogenedentota bacterium]
MRIGTIELEKPLALAPMEDVTDISFRLLCKRLGADLLYTEFVASEALIRDARKAMAKIRVTDEERPVAVQIFGGVETSMEGAAAVAERANPDFIDINCGCWVRNVVLRGEGAGLLKDLPKFEAVVKSVISGTRLPVTVKTRLGWDPDSINIEDVARMVEQAGAQAITIHCRTRSQAHDGDADWSWLERVKRVVSIPVIGNGDLVKPEDVKRMFETGCDGAMIGRGAITNPWIFRETKHFLSSGEHLPPPGMVERVNTCIEHLTLSAEHKGERRGVLEFRKHYGGYLKGLHNAAKFRAEMMQYVEVEPILARLNQYRDEYPAEENYELSIKN